MSQSPDESASTEHVQEYFQNWDALGRMIRGGRSFSGRERNCAFVNLGAGRWADVSRVAGLDQIDDGRGVALTDWDQDGDIDLWITNRTAPRVRFLRNDLDATNHYLQLRLIGKTCNRDAIGARIELHLQNASGQTLIKTLGAGDSFVSQSSKWVHFGVGRDTAIEQLSIRWPGAAATEEFSDIKVDGRYELEQGSGAARPIPTPSRKLVLEASEPNIPQPSEHARVVLTRRRELPDLDYQRLTGETVRLAPYDHGYTLVNLWASWCLPCLEELSALKDREADVRAKHLRIVALCTDVLMSKNESDVSTPTQRITELGFPFESGFALAETVKELTALHGSVVYRERPLPLPTSFLVDRRGQVAIIYKGPVTPDQVLADLDHLETSTSDPKSFAFPFPGRDGIAQFPLSSVGFAKAYEEGGYFDDAEQELVRFLFNTKELKSQSIRRQVASAYLSLGSLLQRQGRWRESTTLFDKALGQFPQHPQFRVARALSLWHDQQQTQSIKELEEIARIGRNDAQVVMQIGATYLRLGQHKGAATHFGRAAQLKPAELTPKMNLATALQAQGKVTEAIALYQQILDRDPDTLDALNNLAWIYSTYPDQQYRHGSRAVELATRLCGRTKYQIPAYLDTLAAAFAESGDFERAVAIVQTATRLAVASGQESLARQLETRLVLFRDDKPYREPVRDMP